MKHIDFMRSVVDDILKRENESYLRECIQNINDELTIQEDEIKFVCVDNGYFGSIVYCCRDAFYHCSRRMWIGAPNKSPDEFSLYVLHGPDFIENADTDFTKKFGPETEEYRYAIGLLDVYKL